MWLSERDDIYMVHNEPKPIKSYYIAYFDILGYKQFFDDNPDKVPDFLEIIHAGIQGTISKILGANQSVLAASIASMNIEIRVFSDNILLCLEELDVPFERVRLLAFIMMTAEIQRGFITQCKLFVRGGITKGMLSINPDYVFGKGLIDAVTMEGKAVYPRIEIASELANMLYTVSSYTQEEGEQAVAIEQRIINGEEVSDEERSFYMRIGAAIQTESMFLRIASSLVFTWPDGKLVLSYLYCFDINSFITREAIQTLLEAVKKGFPTDLKYFNTNPVDIDGLLKRHKEIVEEQLRKYGQNDDIATGDANAADIREQILKKYIWVMAYHNLICEFYKKPDHKILSRCNCDTRFLKMKIEVLENEAGIKVHDNQSNTQE